MPDGYMDAAAVPVPDAGDDTLRDERLRVVLRKAVADVYDGINLPPITEVQRARVADALLPRIREHVTAALRDAAERWRPFIADGRCPTCQMATRETKGMICQTCGTDYARQEPDDDR